MKVFISWSGDLSRKIAVELYEWLPMVVQSISPYMSAESIDKGARWAASIAGELEGASVGIVVLTPENLSAPWIHFEAGALAKVVDESKLAPILFGLRPSDVGTPLSQFQVTQFNSEDIFKLLKSINATAGEDALPEPRLEKMHLALWEELRAKVDPLISQMIEAPSKAKPKIEDETSSILEELLVLVRQQSSIMHSPERFLSPEVISMIMDVASERGMSPPEQRRLQSAVRALRSRWKEYYAAVVEEQDDTDVSKERLEKLSGRVTEVVEDVFEMTHRRHRSGNVGSHPKYLRDGLLVRRPDGVATLLTGQVEDD